MTRLQNVVEQILTRAAPYEFRSFVIGFARPRDYDRSTHEATHRRLKIDAGTALLEHWPERCIDFRNPEVRFDVDPDGQVRVDVKPLFIAGRYRKLSRRIPASRWIHHACRGRGCDACGHTGNLCGPSIQETFSAVALRAVGGCGTFFHGLGREDTDARMLGSGRPFVFEVRRPLRRRLDPQALAEEANDEGRGLAQFLCPRLVDRAAMKAVKSARADKTYRAWISCADRLPPDARDRAERLSGCRIEQLSPTRVMHRRGRSRTRVKHVRDSIWLGELDGAHVWEVRAEAGTYIKELISGDGGRTRPSLAAALETPCTCEALDVLEIHWDPPWEGV